MSLEFTLVAPSHVCSSPDLLYSELWWLLTVYVLVAYNGQAEPR
jgi:hypothetical protein